MFVSISFNFNNSGCELRGTRLIEAAISQIVSYDDVCDGVENELYVVRIRCARHVAVDFFGCRFVLRLELRLDVGSCLAVFLRAWNINETVIFRNITTVQIKKAQFTWT